MAVREKYNYKHNLLLLVSKKYFSSLNGHFKYRYKHRDVGRNEAGTVCI